MPDWSQRLSSAYAACKHCSWNTGRCLHTSGTRKVSLKSGYAVSFALQTKLDKLVNKDRRDGGTPSEKKSDSVDMLTSIMDQCAEIEKDNGDPNQTNFAGMMGVIMQKLLKSKKG